MITISGLTKTHGLAMALSGIDLSIARGESVALIGSRSDGRTMLMRILATLAPPTSGTIAIGGFDVVAEVYRVRRLVAYAGLDRIQANRLRVVEYLRLVAGARGQSSVNAGMAADLVGLNGDASIETLGGELRERLPLAAVLATGADVMLLEQPFRTLDPPATDRVCTWLVGARARGTTLVVADDKPLAGLCERTVVLRAGRIADSPADGPRDRATSVGELVGA